MKQVYLNILFSDDSPFSIGMMTLCNEKFYAEFSDFDKPVPDGIRFKFEPPKSNELEHWMWSKGNSLELRGNKKEISDNILNWFRAILGGAALSWVDYSIEEGGPGYRNIKPIIDTPDIIIKTMTQNEWTIFYDMFESFPKCVHPNPIYTTPVYVETLTHNLNIVPSLDQFRRLYHATASKLDPIDNCKVLISYINTVQKAKQF